MASRSADWRLLGAKYYLYGTNVSFFPARWESMALFSHSTFPTLAIVAEPSLAFHETLLYVYPPHRIVQYIGIRHPSRTRIPAV